MTFYTDLRNVASGLLREFKQGEVEIGRPVVTDGFNEWSRPTTAIQWQTVNAVVRGASQEYNAAVRGLSQKHVDGTSTLATDLQLTLDFGDYNPAAGDRIRIDGQEVSVLRFDRIPAAGTTVAWRVFVRV